MEKFSYLNEDEQVHINGGSEESYELGYSIGSFLGAFTANAAKAFKAFADGVREGMQALKDLPL